MDVGISVGFGGRPAAALLVQQLQLLPDLESNPLATASGREVTDMGLRYADFRGELVLRKARGQKVDNDVFPHEHYDSTCCYEAQQRPLVQHLLSGGYRAHMEPEEIRRLRLREWIDTDPYSNGDVEAWCVHYSKLAKEGEGTLNPTYIRQLVPKKGTPNRNIGERTARRLERIGNKPKGWLDQEPGREQTPATAIAAAVATAEPVAAIDPLSVQLDALRRAVRAMARDFGVSPQDLVSDEPAAQQRIAAAIDDLDFEGERIAGPAGKMPKARITNHEAHERIHGEIRPEHVEEPAQPAVVRRERRS